MAPDVDLNQRTSPEGVAAHLLTLAHIRVGEPVPTLGSSPRAGFAGICAQLSNPVGTFLFSGSSVMPAASAIVSIRAAKSFCR